MDLKNLNFKGTKLIQNLFGYYLIYLKFYKDPTQFYLFFLYSSYKILKKDKKYSTIHTIKSHACLKQNIEVNANKGQIQFS